MIDERSSTTGAGLGEIISTYGISGWRRGSSWFPVLLVLAVFALGISFRMFDARLLTVSGVCTLLLAVGTWQSFRARDPEVAALVCEHGFVLRTAAGMVGVRYSDVVSSLLIAQSSRSDLATVWTVETRTGGQLSLDIRTAHYHDAIREIERHFPDGTPRGIARGSLADGQVG